MCGLKQKLVQILFQQFTIEEHRANYIVFMRFSFLTIKWNNNSAYLLGLL